MKEDATKRGLSQGWLVAALQDAHPEDAAAICAAYLGRSVGAFPVRPLLVPGYDEAQAERAVIELGRCHRDIAVQICIAVLAESVTDGPQHDALGTLKRDAEGWAELAPSHEVVAYVTAGLQQLGQRAIGHTLRKQVFAALWQGMQPSDKAAFLKAVGGA